jgi:hypothetical protein
MFNNSMDSSAWIKTRYGFRNKRFRLYIISKSTPDSKVCWQRKCTANCWHLLVIIMYKTGRNWGFSFMWYEMKRLLVKWIRVSSYGNQSKRPNWLAEPRMVSFLNNSMTGLLPELNYKNRLTSNIPIHWNVAQYISLYTEFIAVDGS